ncbi:MAG: cyclic nucleotide-binding domain-containing protein, partial [Deltaproteobacteria bacterium]|nr:cyclic nucleotide-binding domain-containing protein [Deltaproteobacteria bacterium]
AGRRAVMMLAERVCFAAGQMIIRQGDRGSEVYLIRSGQVLVTTRQNDVAVQLGILESGVVFGEVAEFGHVPRTATVEAITDVDLLRFDGKLLIGLLRSYPAAAKVLSSIVQHRAEDAIQKVSR